MNSTPRKAPNLLIAIALLLLVIPAAGAGDSCTGFKWDVSREVALFGSEATSRAAGSDEASAPDLQPGRLYELTLTPQKDVSFAAAQGKAMLADGAHAGLVRFEVEEAGDYRIALDAGFWVDIVSAGQTIESLDFNGVPGCDRPRKVVLYQLPAGRELVLQLGNAAPSKVRLTITPAN